MRHVITEVLEERVRQHEKFGEQNHSPIEWIAILTEEVGEASKEAVDRHFQLQSKFQPGKPVDHIENYRTELIQVAAVAIQAIQSLDRNERKGKLQGPQKVNEELNALKLLASVEDSVLQMASPLANWNKEVNPVQNFTTRYNDQFQLQVIVTKQEEDMIEIDN